MVDTGVDMTLRLGPQKMAEYIAERAALGMPPLEGTGSTVNFDEWLRVREAIDHAERSQRLSARRAAYLPKGGS